MKASAFRRWPVAGAYSPEQTTRLTGGSDGQRGLIIRSKETLNMVEIVRESMYKS